DMIVNENGKAIRYGDLAQYILDKRIPLEICLSSNLHTGAIDKIENHPFGTLYKEKFRVTINTDDRLMSDTTLTKEFLIAVEHFNLTFEDIEKITINSMKSSFIHYDERLRYIYDVIKPGFKDVKSKLEE
ncbi:MAG: adenosine deaminase, partial [Ignavibacteria bacterium]|nr:adenosine deaminase [Ignavibacteria bacterium]